MTATSTIGKAIQNHLADWEVEDIGNRDEEGKSLHTCVGPKIAHI